MKAPDEYAHLDQPNVRPGDERHPERACTPPPTQKPRPGNQRSLKHIYLDRTDNDEPEQRPAAHSACC